jgi:hypothetical protein
VGELEQVARAQTGLCSSTRSWGASLKLFRSVFPLERSPGVEDERAFGSSQ